MIRLIASDMDGTLLDADSNVPPETFELIVKLKERGIHFVASSGRRYDTLRRFFEPIADQMDFVASNGAQVVFQGELVDREIYSYAALSRLHGLVSRYEGLHLVLFDDTNSYLMDGMYHYGRELDKDLPNPVVSKRLPPADVSIVKASIYCDETIMDMAYALSRELDSCFVFAPSGRRWIDVMQRGVNKATGLAEIMRGYGIRREEVMAFGDAMNDYEILRLAGESRAMGNARPAIKQIASRTIGTNIEHAVQKEMRMLLAREVEVPVSREMASRPFRSFSDLSENALTAVLPGSPGWS